MTGYVVPFVPPARKKGVSRGARQLKQLKQKILQKARTPNANVSNPVPPAGGGGATGGVSLGTLLLGVGLWATYEGLFARPAARASLSDIDPSLLSDTDRAMLYPPSSEILGQITTPSRTEQGFGDEIGQEYEILFEYERDINSGEPPVQVWFNTHYAYRSPFALDEIYFSSRINITADRSGFPEVFGTGRGGRWIIKGVAHDHTGNPTPYSQQAPGQSGIYTPSRGKFLNIAFLK